MHNADIDAMFSLVDNNGAHKELESRHCLDAVDEAKKVAPDLGGTEFYLILHPDNSVVLRFFL